MKKRELKGAFKVFFAFKEKRFIFMAQNYPAKYSLSQAKAALLQHGDTIVADDDPVPKKKWNYVPMFVPTDTGGRAVAHVKTRQGVLDEVLGRWKRWHAFRSFAVFFLVLAILAISTNIILAVAFGAIAGYFAGRYIWDDFFISFEYRTRHLLEST